MTENRRSLVFLSAADVRAALPMREAVDAMKSAFAALSSGDAVLPLRSRIAAARQKGSLLIMPCSVPSRGLLGLKAVTVYDGNAALGLPRIQALVILLNGDDGSPLAVLDGASLTAIRTGAASGAATDLLARRDASTAAILGAGVQGRTQLEAVCAVRAIREAWVFDIDSHAAEVYAHEMRASTGVAVKAAPSAASAVRSADIICTATSASSPVFADADLKAGVHINAVGSYRPDVQEVPAETVLRARVVVDHRESALSEAGDILVPIRQGRCSPECIAAELGEIAGGRRPGRCADDEITFFKSVGVAIQDLAAAAAALDNARKLGLGTTIPL